MLWAAASAQVTESMGLKGRARRQPEGGQDDDLSDHVPGCPPATTGMRTMTAATPTRGEGELGDKRRGAIWARTYAAAGARFQRRQQSWVISWCRRVF